MPCRRPATRARTPAAYGAEYAHRAGIEGTISRGLRRCDLRQARYIGLAKTRLQHILTTVAINFLRLGEWLSGTPRARTRQTPFTQLMASAALQPIREMYVHDGPCDR